MSSDNELLLLLRNNPEKGLEEIMDIYAGFVYTIAYGKLSSVGTKEDIEECVSDIFYTFYRHINAIDLEKGSIKAYLGVISKRKAIDGFRKISKAANKSVSIDELKYDSIPTDYSEVETNVISSETKEILINGIQALGEPDCQIFILKYFYGLSTKMIAQKLKIKENTVDKKVSRGIGKLRTLLGGVL